MNYEQSIENSVDLPEINSFIKEEDKPQKLIIEEKQLVESFKIDQI